MMFDFVVGSVSVYPWLLNQASFLASHYALCEVDCINVRDYKLYLEPYIIRRKEDNEQSDLLRRNASSFLQRVSLTDRVLLGSMEFLGTESNLLMGGKSFPLADGRLRRLNEVLSSEAHTVHLCVACQSDLILSLDRCSIEKKASALKISELSWSNIAFRILRAMPKCKLVVWDFEAAEVAVRSFLSELLATELLEVEWYSLRRIFDLDRFLERRRVHVGSEHAGLCARLDECYETDLHKLITLPRTELRTFSSLRR
jgi:hypothetical protein